MVKFGNKVYIGRGAWIEVGKEEQGAIIEIGSNTTIGRYSVISCRRKIKIGSGCMISYRVSILDHSHRIKYGESPQVTGLTLGEEIIIGNNCFIGANVLILPGVNLGDGVCVGANSVVTKSFPSGVKISGVPAKIIEYLE